MFNFLAFSYLLPGSFPKSTYEVLELTLLETLPPLASINSVAFSLVNVSSFPVKTNVFPLNINSSLFFFSSRGSIPKLINSKTKSISVVYKKDYIDNFFKEFQEQELIKKRAYQERINNENYQHNHKCPRCKSTKIIQVYKRQKGEINNSYPNGELHGTLDTDKVNQCKSCGHEFEYKKQIYLWSDDYYYDKIDIKLISYLFLDEISKVIKELNNFNPNKLTEECITIEEKKIQLSKKLKERSIYATIINYPIEVIIYAALQDGFCRFSSCKEIINFGKYKYDT